MLWCMTRGVAGDGQITLSFNQKLDPFLTCLTILNSWIPNVPPFEVYLVLVKADDTLEKKNNLSTSCRLYSVQYKMEHDIYGACSARAMYTDKTNHKHDKCYSEWTTVVIVNILIIAYATGISRGHVPYYTKRTIATGCTCCFPLI